MNILFERKQTCSKQTSFNVQRVYGRKQYGRRFNVTRDISPTISEWLLVIISELYDLSTATANVEMSDPKSPP